MNELLDVNGRQLALLQPAIATLLQSPNDERAIEIVRSVVGGMQANGTGPLQLTRMLEELENGATITEKITITITQRD